MSARENPRAVVMRVRRLRLLTLIAVATALCAAPGAQARTPCANEQTAPTATNAAQINDAVFCLSNQIRGHYGLPAFRRDARLDKAAVLHSLDMGVRNFFDHVNPDGLDPTARAAAQGYPVGAGENIAYGYANARSVVLGWMGSAGHCRNILSSAADLGVGTAVVGTPHYTQNFGDYFSRAVDLGPRNGCPYTVNLDTLTTPAPGAVSQDYAQDYTQTPVSGPQAQAAATALSLRGLSLSPTRFRAGRGTTISFTLSAPADVTFRIERRKGGRYRTMSGRFTYQGTAGVNTLRYKGRIAGRALRPGRYRLQVVATDAGGASTRAERKSFVIAGR